MKRFLSTAFLFLSTISMAQTVIPISSGFGSGNTRSVGCGNALFVDSGGRNGNYSNSENGVITFCPVIETDLMVMDFTLLNIAVGDVLTVFDGDSTASPVLNTFTNTNTAPGSIIASGNNPSGCLTFRFESNGSDVSGGWEALRSCVNPCQTIDTSITTIPAIDNDGILRICQGETVQFDGQATFGTDATGATFEWDFDNGRGLNQGAMQNETFNESGSYQVRFIATDQNGCTDRNLIDLIVQVSNDPDFSGTAATDTEICLGETTTLTGMVQTVEFNVTPAPPVTGSTFLPDGDGVSYVTCIEVEGFAPGAVFTDATNLISMFMNIEHSWSNDLEIILTAPNGSSIEILQAGASGTNRRLGRPSFNDDPVNPNDESRNPPGTGFEYIIREDAPATGSFQSALLSTPSGASLPAGSFFPNTSFSNFIGTTINGSWCLTITDNLPRDNGYIFEWGLNFDPSLLPDNLSFQPTAVREEWLSDPSIIATNGNVITVQPTATGVQCYTYEFEDSFGCIYTQEVCVTVNELPNPEQPIDLLICDNIGTINTVDLTQNTAILLSSIGATQFNVDYYENITDAQNLNNPIANPSRYTVGSNAQTIFAAITNNATGCSVIRDFQASINRAVLNDVPDLSVCDDPSNDGIELFNLTDQDSFILGSQTDTEVTITYHRSQVEADNNANAILNPTTYTNENSPIQTIFVRVENNVDNTCFASGSFTLTVAGNPVANPITDVRVCDDSSNDGIASFQMGTNDSQLLLAQDPADFEVTYYVSQLDADLRQNAIDRNVFQNTENPQLIIARIDSRLNNSCLETTSFQLFVDPLPQVGTPIDLVQCDDPSGNGMELFDLTANDATILNGQNTTNLEIRYYLSQTDANTGSNEISSPYTSNVPMDEIFVRVQNLTTSCFSTTSFNIIINPVPATLSVSLLESCDSDNDGNAIFRLNDRRDAIIDGQVGVEVNYYNSQAEALSGTGASLNPEMYTSSGIETIFYRTEFTSTGCFTTSSFEIETVAPPVAGIPMAVELCDSGDGTITYNLSDSDAQIQNGLTNTSVTYYETLTQAINADGALDNTLVFSNDTIVFARLENTAGCFDTVELQLNFGELPLPQLIDEVVLCRDSQGTLIDGSAVLDTRLNNADFDFEWRFDGALLPLETEAILITEQQGVYDVLINNRVTGCIARDTTIVRLAGPPDTFTIDITSEPFEENQQIVVTAVGPDEYWYQLDDELFQDSNIFENVSSGIHTITIAERSGCGAVTTEIFVFGFPKFFTPNFDGFNDTWNVSAGDRLPVLNIYIFDRYGKLLKELSPTGAGWDGTFGGEPLPSSDYWFRLEYEFEGRAGEANGHFSLKR